VTTGALVAVVTMVTLDALGVIPAVLALLP
jgi:hypothetical protein